MGRPATQSEIQQVLSRGYSQAEIDRFARDNPNDGNRLLEAFPAKTSASAAPASTPRPAAPTAPASGAPAAGVPGAGGGGAPAGAAAAVAGLNKVVDPGMGSTTPDQASLSLSGGGGGYGGGGSTAPVLGIAQQALRGLGQRIYPEGGSVLQRKAY